MIGWVSVRYYGLVSIKDLIRPVQNGGSLKKDKAMLQVISLNLGFSLKLREGQNFSMKQHFRGGDLLAVLPTGFRKSLISEHSGSFEKRLCSLSDLSTKRGHFNVNFSWLIFQLPRNIHPQ